MKKIFVDLHLCPQINQLDNVKRLIKRAADFGYGMVGLTLPLDVNEESIRDLKREASDYRLDLVTRVDLSPKSSKELLKILSRVRWRFEVVAVECTTKEVAIQAAKDRRIDLLFFPSKYPEKHFFSASEAKLASEKSAALEVSMSPLIYLAGPQRISLIRALRRETSMARKYGVPIVLSSGATDPSMLRRPEDYAFLAYLIDMDLQTAKRSLSDVPRSIVERNRRKLSENYVCPGVYVVRRGEDC